MGTSGRARRNDARRNDGSQCRARRCYKWGPARKPWRAGCSSAWLERCVRDAEVAGSNPVTPTTFLSRERPHLLSIALLFIGSYLFGSIPVGVLVGRAFGFDPRGVGSGNIGMTNVTRAGGKGAGAITFVGDLLKGMIPGAGGADGGVAARGRRDRGPRRLYRRDLLGIPAVPRRQGSFGVARNLARDLAAAGADRLGSFRGRVRALPGSSRWPRFALRSSCRRPPRCWGCRGPTSAWRS